MESLRLSAALLLAAAASLPVPSRAEEPADFLADEGDAQPRSPELPPGVPNILPMPPEGTRVQSDIELNAGFRVGSVMIGGGSGGKLKIQVDQRMRYPDSFQQAEFVNLTIEGRVYFFVEPEVDLEKLTAKLPLKVRGKRMLGLKTKFIAHMPAEYYDHGQLPNVFDPEGLPVGTSVLMKEEDMTQLDTGASYGLLGAADEYQTTQGNALGVERLAADKLRLLAGPTEGVSDNLKLFVGLEREFLDGPVKVKAKVGGGLASYKGLSVYHLRTAIIDPRTEAGKAAFMRFFFTELGRVPETGDGVLKTGTIERVSYLDDASLFVAASADLDAQLPKLEVAGRKIDPKLKVKLGGEAGVNLRQYAQSMRNARYDDGSREIQETIRRGDRLIGVKASLDTEGRVERDEEGRREQKLYVILMRLDEASASYVLQALTQEQRRLKGRHDVELKFTGEEALALRQRARDHMERLRDRCDRRCDPMPGNSLIFNLDLSEPEPFQVALAFTRALSNGDIAVGLLSLYGETVDRSGRGSPIEGAIELAASSK